MSDPTPPNPQAPQAGPWRLVLKLTATLATLALGATLLWHLSGRRLWSEYQKWQVEVRATEDSVPIGYIGANYRRSYNDRAANFHFEKDGKKLLWAAGGAGQTKEFYDVTEADFPVREVDGGFGRDSIPGIDYPILEKSDGEHARNLRSRQNVFGLNLDEGPRAYPEDLLSKIEVVNDRDGDTPFVVVYDRGRGRAYAFKRLVSGQVLSFGTTGYSLRRAPLLYDRKTKSLWQIFENGVFRCVNGPLKGTTLSPNRTAEPFQWDLWFSQNPMTTVLVGNDRSKPIPEE